MSREILFKGKRLDNGEWVQGFYFCMVHDDGRHVHHFIMPEGTDLNLGTPIEQIQVEIDPETICQCVNYAGAWEYDIFRCDDELYLITYSEADLMWEAESLHSSESIQLGEFLEDEIEIVGNLFDNPELAKGTSCEKTSKTGCRGKDISV